MKSVLDFSMRFGYINLSRSALVGTFRLMVDESRNTWSAKIKRTLTSVLPVSKSRKGECLNCGVCCKLPNVCPFLKYTPDGKSYCSIYIIRPLNCRKYPRTESEFITADVCGYRFE
jgi:hypothetical protein